MALKTKLLKTLLVSFSVPLLPIITASCSLSREDYLKNLDEKEVYFTNLLRIKQDEQGIKSNNSIIFDQFGKSLSSSKERLSYRFLDGPYTWIYSKESFFNKITKKINSLYEEFKLPKTLSDEEIKKIFENDFLGGQGLNVVLRKNDILILESINDHSPIALDYAIKEEKENRVNILAINPSKRKQEEKFIGAFPISYLKNVFSVILLPKDKIFEFKRTITDENNQILSDLYSQYPYKPENFYDWFHEGTLIDQRIKRIQKKQRIFNKERFILKNLTDDYISKLPLDSKTDSKLHIIKDPDDFIEFLVAPFQKDVPDKDNILHEDSITKDFRSIFSGRPTLKEIFEKYDIVIQRFIKKPNKPSNRPAKLVKMPSSTGTQIDLAFIDERKLNFDFESHDDKWNDSFSEKPRIFYQGLLVPKGSQVKIHGELSFKETSDFLLASKPLYQVEKVDDFEIDGEVEEK
ncbi:hypothetical protein NPA08_03140 [Mycoplasmopsis citelli]|uniref:Lipoprotein n=1 Tax=Mycoplasmopsis citelli TaxID=171281 RepID=A0A449B1I3_9BACT|nr:hypothetical protein [Mycoplasmopsis citelli]UUD35930.1 hypothetical protein NPA08_03140 [Mycoplasmopsis citelli]VEU74469.1 Uncharacterised protein [Mycoplasmopsis citelli]